MPSCAWFVLLLSFHHTFWTGVVTSDTVVESCEWGRVVGRHQNTWCFLGYHSTRGKTTRNWRQQFYHFRYGRQEPTPVDGLQFVMVCTKRLRVSASGMSTSYAREVVATCTQSHCRMQCVADLLLLNSDVRPVNAESLAVFHDSYSKCRETVITRTKGLLVMTGRINEQLHNVLSKWLDVCNCILDMTELVVGLIECCAHAAYLVAVSKPNCVPAQAGVVDAYRIRRAHSEIELLSNHFRHLTIHELTPSVLMQICSDISKNLTVLTDCCRVASENTADVFDQEQFRMCVKSFTNNASCLLSSIRCFKAKPTAQYYGRCIGFYDALTASTKALVNFATEDSFLGTPATLTSEATEAKKSIFSEYGTHSNKGRLSASKPCAYSPITNLSVQVHLHLQSITLPYWILAAWRAESEVLAGRRAFFSVTFWIQLCWVGLGVVNSNYSVHTDNDKIAWWLTQATSSTARAAHSLKTKKSAKIGQLRSKRITQLRMFQDNWPALQNKNQTSFHKKNLKMGSFLASSKAVSWNVPTNCVRNENSECMLLQVRAWVSFLQWHSCARSSASWRTTAEISIRETR